MGFVRAHMHGGRAHTHGGRAQTHAGRAQTGLVCVHTHAGRAQTCPSRAQTHAGRTQTSLEIQKTLEGQVSLKTHVGRHKWVLFGRRRMLVMRRRVQKVRKLWKAISHSRLSKLGV